MVDADATLVGAAPLGTREDRARSGAREDRRRSVPFGCIFSIRNAPSKTSKSGGTDRRYRSNNQFTLEVVIKIDFQRYKTGQDIIRDRDGLIFHIIRDGPIVKFALFLTTKISALT